MKERINLPARIAGSAARSAAFTRGPYPAFFLLLLAVLNSLLALLLSADACAATVRPAAMLAGYFRRPLLLTLNVLPAAALAMAGYLLTNRAAAAYLRACGITDGYVQERSSAKEEYTPDFDLGGI